MFGTDPEQVQRRLAQWSQQFADQADRSGHARAGGADQRDRLLGGRRGPGHRGFADRLDQAVAAAWQVSMPDDAYGLICQFLPPALNPLEERGVAALQSSTEGVDTTATNVKDTAGDYAADDQHAAGFRRMGGAL